MELPVGPPRTRASDRDREQIIAFIRGHWQQGRIGDEELERRVGLALQARTLGDFRELCADLPAPPRSGGERIRRRGGYALRLLRSPGGAATIVVAGLFALAVLGAIVDDPDEQRRTAGPPPAVPPQVPAPGGEAPPPPEERTTRGRIGQVLEDGGVAFQVRRIRTERSVAQRADRGGGAITPGDNRQFIVATVRIENRASPPADPFCGSNGAELRVAAGEAVDPIGDLYDLEGNQGICSGGIPEGDSATHKLVFQVPAGDEARRLDVWNADEPGDILGNTRIAVRP